MSQFTLAEDPHLYNFGTVWTRLLGQPRQPVPLAALASTALKGKADTAAVSTLSVQGGHKPWDAMQVQKQAYKLSGVAVGV